MTDPLPEMSAEESSARVIRALLDYRSIWTTHDLVELSQAPSVDVRRIIDDLQAESLIERRRGGIIAVPDWSLLLSRWAANSPVLTTSQLSRWKAPKDLFDRLATSPLKYALTSEHAAAFWTATPTANNALIYTPDAQSAATAWRLTPAPRGDIVLAEPPLDVVYLRRRSTPTGLRLAAPAQVLADLLSTSNGRPTPVSTNLTNWMHAHLFEWRY
ncbi:hypothetical protein GCM10009745_03930 [Kribbella yunnanensis]|uniref:MarR family transcriptional regulator n=1 Tax=Kribbella yunnanensis TaxID=190194 RepID=A0ABN2G4N8_9ACTN